MAFYLVSGEYYIEMDNGEYEWIGNNLEYNPILQDGEMIGFCLRGDRIIPVVDLQEALNIKRAAKKIYIIYKDVAFVFEYEKISSNPSEKKKIDLVEIAKRVKEFLGVEM